MEYFNQLRAYVERNPVTLPGSLLILKNESGQILLQHRTDGSWGLPGGLMDLGEALAGTASREALEEAGLRIGELKLMDVLSGPDYYSKISNGDEFYSVTVLFSAQEVTGEIIAEGDESTALRYFDLENLPEPMEQQYLDCIAAYKRKINLTVKR